MKIILFLLIPCLAWPQHSRNDTFKRVYMRNGKITRIVTYRDAVMDGKKIKAKSTTQLSVGLPGFSVAVKEIGAEVDTLKSLDWTLAALKGKPVLASKPGSMNAEYTAKQITKPLLRSLVKQGYSLSKYEVIVEPINGRGIK